MGDPVTYRITLVDQRLLVGGLLADDGARRRLRVAPVLCIPISIKELARRTRSYLTSCRQRNTVGIDVVVLSYRDGNHGGGDQK